MVNLFNLRDQRKVVRHEHFEGGLYFVDRVDDLDNVKVVVELLVGCSDDGILLFECLSLAKEQKLNLSEDALAFNLFKFLLKPELVLRDVVEPSAEEIGVLFEVQLSDELRFEDL